MGVSDKSRVLMQRLEPKHRTLHTSKTRTDLHLQQKKSRIYNKLTTAERKSQNERREKKRNLLNARLKSCDAAVWKMAEDMATDFGYDAYHWYHHILQNARMAKKQRKANCWNAFVKLYLEPINNALPEGVPKKKASDPDIAVKMKDAWDAMTKDEQEAFTAPRVKEMEEEREVRDGTKHNTAIAAFHDIRTSMQSIIDQLRDLYLRTGLEILMFGVRGSEEHFNRPFVLSTSDKGTDFFHTCFKQLPSIWVTSFEAYVLLGVDGMKNTQAIELSRLKGACSALVLEQMRTVAAPANIPKMHYQDFYEQFTLRHHIVCEDWPIPSFCTPHKLGIVELRTLFDRLTNEDAPPLFRVLTPAEWKVHSSERSTRAPATNAATPVNTVFVADGPSMQHPTPHIENVSGQQRNNTSAASTSSATNSSSQDASSSSSSPAHTLSTTSSTAPCGSNNPVSQKARKPRSDKNKPRPHATKAYKKSQGKQPQAQDSSAPPQNEAANAPQTTGAPAPVPPATFTSVFSLSPGTDSAGPTLGLIPAAGSSRTAGTSTPHDAPHNHTTSSTRDTPLIHGPPSVHGSPALHGVPSIHGTPSMYGTPSIYGYPPMYRSPSPSLPVSPLSMYAPRSMHGPPSSFGSPLDHSFPPLHGFPPMNRPDSMSMSINGTTSTRDTPIISPNLPWMNVRNVGGFTDGSMSANHANGARLMIDPSIMGMGSTPHTNLMAGSTTPTGVSFASGMAGPSGSSAGSSSTEGGTGSYYGVM